MKGYLSIVLHAHLPYVRHPETDGCLEERWLFEAITETYIPLLRVFEGLLRDGVDFRVTMTLTPTLLAMLEDPLLQGRYRHHAQQLVELATREAVRTQYDVEIHRLAEYYMSEFQGILDYFESWDGNLIQAFRRLQETKKLEIITCAATHAFLPYVQTREAIAAQICTAVRDYARHFGRAPQGIWLPECGYHPGIDSILEENGIRYFFVGADAFSQVQPCPVRGTMEPLLTDLGIAAFPRDEESAKQVWSSLEGYPGDYDYREYYRDIGYDLGEDEIRSYLHPSGVRHNTGIKYYRITGRTDDKQPYNLERARDKAALHAGHFFDCRIRQITDAARLMDTAPIVVAPYDAELFGHWWYEGPQWLDFLFRKFHHDQEVVELVTPSEYLEQCGALQVCDLGLSSWGLRGFGEVWLNSTNDWIYPALHACEEKMRTLATRFSSPSPEQSLALNQAARELMLAQSSDFAFIMDHQTMTDYAVKRTKSHIHRFLVLWDALMNEDELLSPELLSLTNQMNQLSPLFPLVDYRDYCPADDGAKRSGVKVLETARRPTVLMLSWEFPPVTVGGLSRHVYDLARFLVKAGWEVHVLTTRAGGSLHDEVVEGVCVHRVDVLQPDGGQFVHWAFQFNLAMLERSQSLLSDVKIDVIHAHDWMVCYTAKMLKTHFGIPLVATIHATEHGRNGGIHSPLQEYIHNLEWELTYEACRVVLCSSYMQREMETVFSLPADKQRVIPNGVDPAKLKPTHATGHRGRNRPSDSPIVLFIGRLVREKGVQVLIEAAPQIIARCANTRFVILGTGPYEKELKEYTDHCGVAHLFEFPGFVSDEVRNDFLQSADVAVFPSLYEPFGIVALEAMAAGIPVVVSDVGGLADVVQHLHNGRKAYSGNAASLALQVSEAILDIQESRNMAEVALAEIDRYDWLRIAKETENVYAEALTV